MITNAQNEFTTKDLPLIASLIATGEKPINIFLQNNEVYFSFQNTVINKVQQFYEYRLDVDAHTFANSMKETRNKIKELLKNNEENGKCQKIPKDLNVHHL